MKNYSETYDFTLFHVESDGARRYVASVYGDEMRIDVMNGTIWYYLYMNGSVIMSVPDRTGNSVKLVAKGFKSEAFYDGVYSTGYFHYEFER